MLSSVESHRKGLEAGMDIAKVRLNEILEVECPNLGSALAEVEFLKRKYKYLKQDYDDLQLELKERADWK
jgi:hypothetical protein